MSDDSGLASWRSPSELSGFFGQNYSVLIPDVMNNTVEIQVSSPGGILTLADAVIVNGPSLEIERVPGFLGTNSYDEPGPNMENPFVFEYGGPRTNDLRTWYQQYTNNPASDRRDPVLMIKNLAGQVVETWSLFEMGLTQIEPGTDGRNRYTLRHGRPPDNLASYQRNNDGGTANSKNPATDFYRIEIEAIANVGPVGPYPSIQIDYTNRTITLVFDYAEAGAVHRWVRNTAGGTDHKRNLGVITESNGTDVSLRRFFGVFPISFQQTTGFGQVNKLKEKVVVSFDWWEDG